MLQRNVAAIKSQNVHTQEKYQGHVAATRPFIVTSVHVLSHSSESLNPGEQVGTGELSAGG